MIIETELKGYATHANAAKVLAKAFATLSPADQHAFARRFLVLAKADGRFVPAVCAGDQFHVVNHLIFRPWNILVFN
jgi:hypothetical protein